MVRCRGCQEPIDFVPLRSGKRMPVESTEAEEYRVFGDRAAAAAASDGDPSKLVLVVEGEVLTVWQAWSAPGDGTAARRRRDGPLLVRGVESHFATCPAAGAFRRR